MITLHLELSIEEIASLQLSVEDSMKEVQSWIKEYRDKEALLIYQSASKEKIKDVAQIADYYEEHLKVLDSILKKISNY